MIKSVIIPLAITPSWTIDDNNNVINIYEHSEEIAEMRFRGYDLLANRLQQRLRDKPHI